MAAIIGAQLGIAIRCVTSGSALMPSPSPTSAKMMGSPIAMSEPNATIRITAATATPTTSPSAPSGVSNAKNNSPAASI
jgi:hypothetical protein